MKNIKLIIGSTRKGRIGKPVSDWLVSVAKDADINLEVLDLQEIQLPFFDAAVPPAYMPDESEAGKAWAAKVAEAEGFVFVTPEYNRSIPASLKNALDFLVTEWKGKPAAIVSYGYVDGGASATEHLKDVFAWLKITVVGPDMGILLSQDTFDEKGEFKNIEDSLSGVKEDFLVSLRAINEA